MHALTARHQNVTVMTVSTLHDHLERISTAACKFTIDKAHRDRVSVRGDYLLAGKKKHSYVILPAYPTGYPGDSPCNNLNVVLDPLDFQNVDSCTEREVFTPLLGEALLEHYEKMHSHTGLLVTRCC